jgi:hypothetical protein
VLAFSVESSEQRLGIRPEELVQVHLQHARRQAEVLVVAPLGSSFEAREPAPALQAQRIETEWHYNTTTLRDD